MRVCANGITIAYRWDGQGGEGQPAESRPPGAEAVRIVAGARDTPGAAIMLSHSLATDLTMWEPQVGVLATRCPLLRYDTRGHGGTSVPAGPYSIDLLADDAAALLDALGIPRVCFVGLSLGGMIGQVFALRYPERLAALVLCSSSPRTPPEARKLWDERLAVARTQGMEPLVEATVGRWFTPSFIGRHKELVDRVRESIRSTDPVGYAACGEAVKSHDQFDRLSGIRAPTLIIVGSEDHGVSVETAQEMQRRIKGAELAVIERASHLCNLEQPDRFNELVVRFLARGA